MLNNLGLQEGKFYSHKNFRDVYFMVSHKIGTSKYVVLWMYKPKSSSEGNMFWDRIISSDEIFVSPAKAKEFFLYDPGF